MKRLKQSVNPKFSVVIPAYNEEGWIVGCLQSLAAQNTEVAYEVIVVDNNSTDQTAKLAKQSGVKVVHEPHKGLPAARERGRQAAKGNIIVYLDADTLVEPDYLNKLDLYFKTHPEYIAVSNPYTYFDGSLGLNLFVSSFFWGIFPIYRRLLGLFGQALVFGGAFAVKAGSLEQIGGFNADLTFYGEDTEIAKRLSNIGKVGYMLNVKVQTSARRFNNEGTLHILWVYQKHHISMLFRNKPAQTKARGLLALRLRLNKGTTRIALALSTLLILLGVNSQPALAQSGARHVRHFEHRVANRIQHLDPL